MYEHRTHPLLARRLFIRRMFMHALVGFGLLVFSLALGMTGYWYYEDLGWRDAFLNAAMLMGGMGPVDAPKTDGGKLFAGLYALYAGLVFIVAAGLLIVPAVHRIMHKFHLEDERQST